MQKEYKEAMQKICLSDSDKERILANVKKAYEESSDTVISLQSRPRFSARQIGVAAAAFVALVVSAVVIGNQFMGTDNSGDVNHPVVIAENDREEWIELDSIRDIAEKTDCKTYTLSNVSKSYKVKEIRVEKEKKHVKITYKSKKHKDKILFEYKEEENAPDVTEQFAEQEELAKETVDDKEVILYGEDECDGMTWQQESCTFAVTMSKSCSTEKAVKLVEGTKKENSSKGDGKKDGPEHVKKISRNAVGWEGEEQESTEKQRRDVLSKVYELYGFRVTINSPAEKVSYKLVKNFESFQFTYPEVEELEKHRVVGYAGRDGSPNGVLDDFTEGEVIAVNGISVQTYMNEEGEEIYTFTKQDINFTLLIGKVSVEEKSRMLSGLMSVIHISWESGQEKDAKETEKPAAEETEKPEEDEPDMSQDYRETAQNIQYAVADGSLKKLSSYIEFPLTIKGLDISVASAKEFQSLNVSEIFTGKWVDNIASFDTGKIKNSTKTFTMGSGSNYLICKIKNNSVLITELCIERIAEEPIATPSEE